MLVGENEDEEDDGFLQDRKEIEINECMVQNIEGASDEDLGFVDHVYENESKSDIDLLKLTEEQLAHLEVDKKDELLNIIQKNRSSFADKLSELREPAKIPKFKIKLKDTVQVRKPIYTVNKKMREVIKAEVDKLLEASIIRHSVSPYSAPAVPVAKKNEAPRMCVDLSGLNDKTEVNAGPVVRQDDIFDEMSESEIFSEFDLKSAFHQQAVEEEDIHKTAFSTWDGHYEWLRKPMGCKNGSVDHSLIMSDIFRGVKCVCVYIDNVIINSKSFKQHIEDIKLVFSILHKYNLKLNRKKCVWAKPEIKILGHVISKDGIKMDSDKIKAIQDMKTPTKVLHIQQFLGLTGYYRHFIRNYAEIAAPLNNLVRKDVKWKWTSECEDAFNKLKNKLMK